MNYNFHDRLDAKAQRLLNAMEPGTELAIHRHQNTAETYMVVRGSIEVVYYNEKKEVIDTFIIDPKKEEYGIHIPIGQWHTLEVLEKYTVIFEVKDGPYMAFKEEDVLR